MSSLLQHIYGSSSHALAKTAFRPVRFHANPTARVPQCFSLNTFPLSFYNGISSTLADGGLMISKYLSIGFLAAKNPVLSVKLHLLTN